MFVAGHLVKTFFKAIGRIFVTAVVCGAIGFGVVLLLAYVRTNHWAPDVLTWVSAIAVGVLALYAGGITVLMQEAVRALQEVARDVEHEAGSALKGAGNVVQEIEKRL
ncbi:MAG TPA: hypothetical protein VF792_08375 [Ktedonobacterales bacterium]